MNGLKRYSGIMLLLTGVIHNIVGLLVVSDPLLSIAKEGIIFSLQDDEWEQQATFWFFMFGFLFMLLGALMHWVLRTLKQELPPFLGWSVLAICTLGVLMMPVSGFWLGLPQAWIILRRTRRS